MSKPRLGKIRVALSARGCDGESWRRQKAALAQLCDEELDLAEEFERAGKRRPEILKMILYDRARRRGWKWGAYPAPEVEGHL